MKLTYTIVVESEGSCKFIVPNVEHKDLPQALKLLKPSMFEKYGGMENKKCVTLLPSLDENEEEYR